LFRGYLYGKLRKITPIWVAIVMTSLTFGVAHLWTGGDGPLQWAVMIDTFVLSLVMCVMREHTGAIWITILMHMAKNGLAFYLLFVNPQIVEQIKAAILPLL
jgi:membrane protease YdiL (CAAX protease family)